MYYLIRLFVFYYIFENFNDVFSGIETPLNVLWCIVSTVFESKLNNCFDLNENLILLWALKNNVCQRQSHIRKVFSNWKIYLLCWPFDLIYWIGNFFARDSIWIKYYFVLNFVWIENEGNRHHLLFVNNIISSHSALYLSWNIKYLLNTI